MKKILFVLIVVLTLGISLWNPALLLAGEHGGSTVKEHGGQEYSGKTMEGSHSHEENSVATIREAAAILKSTHPELAAKLEKIAAEEE